MQYSNEELLAYLLKQNERLFTANTNHAANLAQQEKELDEYKQSLSWLSQMNSKNFVSYLEQKEEVDKVKKELSSTNFLYEAYQDNYELLLEKHNSLVQEYGRMNDKNEEIYNELEAAYNQLEQDLIDERREGWKLYFEKEEYKNKYNKLLESHAEVMEENVCFGIKFEKVKEDVLREEGWKNYWKEEATELKTRLENEAANNKQMLEAKEKFYNILLNPPVQKKSFLDNLYEQDELSENNTLIFCTDNYQATRIKDFIKSYNNVTLNSLGNNYTFPNGARLFVKVVTNLEEAYTRYGGLVGNNVLVNSSMKGDVELCRWACSRARYTTKGYQPQFIVWE